MPQQIIDVAPVSVAQDGTVVYADEQDATIEAYRELLEWGWQLIHAHPGAVALFTFTVAMILCPGPKVRRKR